MASAELDRLLARQRSLVDADLEIADSARAPNELESVREEARKLRQECDQLKAGWGPNEELDKLRGQLAEAQAADMEHRKIRSMLERELAAANKEVDSLYKVREKLQAEIREVRARQGDDQAAAPDGEKRLRLKLKLPGEREDAPTAEGVDEAEHLALAQGTIAKLEETLTLLVERNEALEEQLTNRRKAFASLEAELGCGDSSPPAAYCREASQDGASGQAPS